jgi:hypothetical protein
VAHPVRIVEPPKPQMLNQETINHNLPVRVWPSKEMLLVDNSGQVVGSFEGFKVQENDMKESVNDNNLSEKEVIESDTHPKDVRTRRKVLLKGLGFINRLRNRSSNDDHLITSNEEISTSNENSGGSGESTQNENNDDCCDENKIEEFVEISFIDNITNDPSKGSFISDLRAEVIDIQEEELSCSICLSEYTMDDQLRILPCHHEYHAECIGMFI